MNSDWRMECTELLRLAGTFSSIALDRTTADLGEAVALKYFAVGSVVPWARAGVGVMATQD